MKFIGNKFSFLIFIPIIFGFFISFYSWDGVVYFFDRDNSRIPADSSSIFNLKNIKSRIKGNTNSNIIAEQTVISRTDGNITLNFKNFYVSDKKTSVCTAFDNIKLSFVALNVAVSGEPPIIYIESPCIEDQSNAEYIATINIPLNDIKSLPPSTRDTQLFENLKIEFSNIEDEWPIDFRLKKVQFLNKENKQNLLIDVYNTKPFIEFQL